MQALDAARDERVKADAKPDNGEEHGHGANTKLPQQALPIDGLRQTEIVNQQDQSTPCRTQFAWLDGHRRRHDERQQVAVEAEQTLGLATGSHALHDLCEARPLTLGQAKRPQVHRAANPVAPTAEDDSVILGNENRRANLFEYGELAELALRDRELIALGGALGSALNLRGAHQFGAFEVPFECRLLDLVGNREQHEPDDAAVERQEQWQPESQRLHARRRDGKQERHPHPRHTEAPSVAGHRNIGSSAVGAGRRPASSKLTLQPRERCQQLRLRHT